MKECLDKIPSYEELKNSEENMHYYIFEICGSIQVAITCKEDGEKNIALDYYEHGYLQNFNFECNGKYITLNKLYPLNKKNYELIIKQIRAIKEELLNIINNFEV